MNTDPTDSDAISGPQPLQGMLEQIHLVVGDRQTVLLGELMDALGARGFGPVILLTASIMVLPTGMIPMVPAFMGLVLLLAAGQMLRGRQELWLPPRLYRVQIPGPTVHKALAKAAPTVDRLGRQLRPQWQWLASSRISMWLIALILAITSLGIIAIGAIPGLPFLLAFHLLAFGIGMTAGDGRFMAAGYLLFLPSALLAIRLAELL